MRIPITKPVIDENDIAAVTEPLRSGWLVQGPKVKAFEERFADFVGSPHAVATTSCTTALQIALVALGIGPGDEVIVPAFTYVATANVVECLGAKPVFCDIDLLTYNINVAQLEEKISDKTRGIIPVHLFGLAADMDAIMEIAERYGLAVVEDAACGLGSYYGGRHVGNFGNLGCFSFHPRKAITTGEGGMLVTKESGLAELCRMLRDHGASTSDFARQEDQSGFLLPEFNHLGYNYRMTDIQAALGVAQMEKADRILSQRKKRAERYDEILGSLSELRCPTVPEKYAHGYQSYVCMLQPTEVVTEVTSVEGSLRNRLMARLDKSGISCRPGTHAVVSLGYYRKKYKLEPGYFPNAIAADRLTLALPLYAEMTDREQDFVATELRRQFPRLVSEE